MSANSGPRNHTAVALCSLCAGDEVYRDGDDGPRLRCLRCGAVSVMHVVKMEPGKQALAVAEVTAGRAGSQWNHVNRISSMVPTVKPSEPSPGPSVSVARPTYPYPGR